VYRRLCKRLGFLTRTNYFCSLCRGVARISVWGAQVEARDEDRDETRRDEGGWVWGGGVPLPTGGGVWERLCPLPRKIFEFFYQNGEFWCILGAISYRLAACFI